MRFRYACFCVDGDCAKCGRASSRQTHDGALDVQMSSAGRKPLLSSRLLKRMDMKSGLASPVVNKGLPQWAQKLRVTRRPLDTRTAYSCGEPVTSTDARGTTTPEANGAPLDC